MGSTRPDRPADVLGRWLASGGECRVLDERHGELTVALLTCDGGEEMGRVVGPERDLRALVDRR